MRKYLAFAILILTWDAFAQVPVITDISPVQTYPKDKLVITGSGFSSTPANLDVWFDNVKGTITSSSDFAIEVTIPINARLGNVEVINKSSKLSAKSPFKFEPYYSGESFAAGTIALKFEASEQVSPPAGASEINDLCTCDFDGDGKADIAGTKTAGTASDIAILRNTSVIGNISFVSSILSLGFPTFNSVCGDLDGDGKPDLVATRGGGNRNEILVRRNTSGGPGSITFAATANLILDVGHIAFRPVIHDLNGDGKPEIIVSNAFDSPGNIVYVFVNQSTTSLSFNSTPLKFTVSEASSSYGIDVQDLDGDEKPEIIVNQFNKPDLFILKNTSTTQVNFAAAQKIALGGTTGTLNHLTTADFNNDDKLDIALTNSTVNNKVHVMINNSTASTYSFTELGAFNTGDGAFGIDVSDLDGDKDIDIIVGNIDFSSATQETEVTVMINTGSSFTPVNINTGKKSRNIEAADYDGDGKPDIAFTTVTGNSIDVLRNKNCFVPTILNETPLAVCSGQTITLSAISNDGATYQWKESGTDLAGETNATLDITAAGDYSVTATSESATCSTSASISVSTDTQSVTQNPTLTGATAGVITVCAGTALQLNTSDTEPDYEWTGPNEFSSTDQNPNVTSSVSSDHAGIYELVLKNGVCRSNIGSVRVDVVNLQSFVVTSNPTSGVICQAGTATLSTASVSGHTYQWIKEGTGDISGQTSSSLSVSQEGSYRVRVTRTDFGCTTETENVPVTILTQPSASFTVQTTACIDEEVAFTNTSQRDTRGTVVFAWNFGDSSGSSEESPTHTYTTAQSVNASLTVSYQGVTGCTSTTAPQPINIVAPATLTITAPVTDFCPGEPVTLSIPAEFTSVLWSTGQISNEITVIAAGTLTVDASDANNCPVTSSVVITEKPVPTVTIATDPDPPTVPPGITIQLTASGADTYSWLPTGTLDNASIANPVASPEETTIYTVTGTETDGCSAEASVTVTVEGELKITNVFSPNGDGVNDFWVIPGIQNYSECTLSIFDSHGRKIYEKAGYQNDWDGTYSGKQVPRGTYYYVIGGCPDKTTITGHLLVAY